MLRLLETDRWARHPWARSMQVTGAVRGRKTVLSASEINIWKKILPTLNPLWATEMFTDRKQEHRKLGCVFTPVVVCLLSRCWLKYRIAAVNHSRSASIRVTSKPKLHFPKSFLGQMKHQLDATLCRFYFCRVTLHVSGASAHHQEYLKLVHVVHVLSLQVSHHISLLGPKLQFRP